MYVLYKYGVKSTFYQISFNVSTTLCLVLYLRVRTSLRLCIERTKRGTLGFSKSIISFPKTTHVLHRRSLSIYSSTCLVHKVETKGL